jgi:DNA-binding MarR family transcriptional regulator
MPKADEIDYLLQHLTSLSARHSDQFLQEQLGIGYAQFKILRIVGEGLPFKQKYIADVLGQTEASISRQIKLLMSEGYITAKKDPRNRRVHLIEITAAGEQIYRASLGVLGKYRSTLLNSMSDKKQQNLVDLLTDLHSTVCGINHNVEADYVNYLLAH